jgi:hypothetical protein
MPRRLIPHLMTLAAVVVATLPIYFAAADETYYLDEPVETPSVYFSKYTWLMTEHPKILNFTWLPNGDSYGRTTTGVPFKQYTVPTDAHIRVQRFEIQDHFHYIVEGAIIGSLEALSAHLAASYNALGHQ